MTRDSGANSWADFHSQRKLPKYSYVQDCMHETMDELPPTRNSRASPGLEQCRHRVTQNVGDSKAAEMVNGWHWLVWLLIGPCLFLEKRFMMPQSKAFPTFSGRYCLPERSLFTGQLLHMQHGMVVQHREAGYLATCLAQLLQEEKCVRCFC